jgi:protoheme IX farnesyltransferase
VGISEDRVLSLIAAPVARAPSAMDYLMLMKPRVMSLVIFTALVGWLVAPGVNDPILGFASILAIAAAAGAAGALNMWYDADIDAKMRRTRARPVPAGRIAGDEALALGLVVSILSVLVMALAAGWFPAALLAFSIWFYAVVYTMWLKRRTPQNIVIGGLAGALPPAIAWAAKTGGLALDPIILVAIIFMWTPPHFWALALYQRGDYAAAGVPMLPVSHGAKATRAQILIYSLALAPLGLAPVATGLGGLIYAIVAPAGGALFALLAVRVARSQAGEQLDAPGGPDLYAVKRGDKAARDLFAFSILYLFLLFAALFAERAFGLFMPIAAPSLGAPWGA